jgi:hypothetical protein
MAEIGVLTLHLDKKIEIVVSGQEARRLVNNWAHLELSSQMRAMRPQLVIMARGVAHWRVPLHLTFPALGDVGPVGVVLVDVQTGQMNPTVDPDRLNLLGQLFAHLEAEAILEATWDEQAKFAVIPFDEYLQVKELLSDEEKLADYGIEANRKIKQ